MGRRRAFLEEAVQFLAKEKINATILGAFIGKADFDSINLVKLNRDLNQKTQKVAVWKEMAPIISGKGW